MKRNSSYSQKKKAPCYSKGCVSLAPYRGYREEEGEVKFVYHNACEILSICNEGYLYLDSEKTRKYRKKHQTSFTGCDRLEKVLISEGLLAMNMKETTYKEFWYPETVLDAPRYDYEVIALMLDRNKYLNLGADENTIKSWLSFIKIPQQKDLKMIILSKMIKSVWYHTKKEGKDYLFISFLLLMGMNDYDEALLALFPQMNRIFFKSIQAKVYYDIQKRIPVKFLFLREAMKTLTVKQKNAIKAYITHNEGGYGLRAVAKKMGITAPSLKDRIDGAKKKIKRWFEKNVPDWEKIVYLRS